MSATLGECGELERSYGVDFIYRLPILEGWKNKDIGRRFFIFPFAFVKDEKPEDIMFKIVKRVNRALILVNDLKTQSGIERIFKECHIGKTFNGKSIEQSKEEFITSDNAYAVIANRFDGIDFPDDECRVLILFNIPTVAHIQEKFLITKMASRTLFEERIRTRIIQAMGRCNRSQTDYAAICVLSNEVMEYLLLPSNTARFNPELQAEIKFGLLDAEVQTNINDYLKDLDIFIEHNDVWEETEKDIISIRDSLITNNSKGENIAYKELSKSTKHEVRFQYALWKQDYAEAMQEVDNILVQLQSDELKGYRGYWEYMGGCCAFALYKEGKSVYEAKYKKYFQNASNSTIAVNWFKYEESNNNKTNDYSIEMLLRLEKLFAEKGNKGLKRFVEYLDEILDLLNSGGTDFERGHELLGEISGFKTTNPKGTAEPDPIWILNRELCIVAEDKIYKDGKLIPPNDVKEAAGHEVWVRKKCESLDLSNNVRIITVFITTAVSAQENTTLFGEGIYYLKSEELKKWAEKVIPIIKELYSSFTGEGDNIWRENALNIIRENNITPKNFIDMITKRKLTEL